MGRSLARALLVLGGAAAATAASWALATATADATPDEDAAIDTVGVDTLHSAATSMHRFTRSFDSEVANAAALESLGDAVDGIAETSVSVPTSMAYGDEQCSQEPVDCAGQLVEPPALGELTDPSTVIGDANTEWPSGQVGSGSLLLPQPRSPSMVAGVASLLWSDPPRSQQNTDSRTVSGSSAPIGTNDAPPRLPASVPLTVPATPAGGSGVTGSSIGLLATDFVADQLLPDIDATSVMQPDGVQRPITMNAQPGVAPD